MLWLNTTTGEEIQSPKRPSPAWVSIVEVEIGGITVDSTLNGLANALMSSDKNAIGRRDINEVSKTELNIFANERYWKQQIETSGFPYIITKLASDGTLEITYDENAKDDTSKDTIRTKGITQSNPDLKIGGGRQTSGKSGQKGPPQPGPMTDGEGDPSGEDGEDGEGQGEGEGEEGQGEGDGEGEGESTGFRRRG